MYFLLTMLACNPPATADEEEAIEPYDPVAYVDPFIGTGGVGAEVASVSPGATRPFGMTLIGPDTAQSYGAPGFYHCAGYHYPDDRIMGFSHTHAHGMGVPDYGTIQVMPTDGWDLSKTDRSHRAATFSHDSESASPGRYEVTLENGIKVEIAASERGAAHRTTFASGMEPVLVFDLAFALGEDHVAEGRAAIDLIAGEVEGFQRLMGSYSGRYGGLQTSFVARFDPVPIASGTWAEGVEGDSASVDGAEVGFWLRFPENTTTVSMDLAISYVDTQGAWGNLSAELPRFDLDAASAAAEDAWREELKNVRIRGEELDKRIFHTAQYHSMIMPSLNQDVDGRYRGLDGAIHTIDHNYYSDFSLWDSFRTLHPWLLLARPDRERDLVRSLIKMTDDGGSLPRWPLAHGYTGGMVGTPAVQVLAEAALKDLGGFDAQHALDISINAALHPQPNASRGGLRSYQSMGYVSMDETAQAASKTLEYAWSDHALALWTEAEGRAEAPMFRSLASNWKNTFDPAQGWFVGRYDDGSFAEIRSPTRWVESYTEGNAYHYRWGPIWDIDGLVASTYGGDQSAALNDVRTYWHNVAAEEDDLAPDDYYWHGNEPDLHYAMIPTLLGDAELTTGAINLILDTRYHAAPRGLDGNDDSGTLSAWYLFQSIGFYPLAGTPDYIVGSPRFSRVEIDQPDGTTLVIKGTKLRGTPTATLGEDELGSFFSHKALLREGTLTL